MRIPEPIAELLRTLERAGERAYLVGGCVRDGLLGRPVHDWDVTTSARPETVAALFARTVPTGLRHGTTTVLSGGYAVEVTTFRAESAYSDHRRPDAVAFVDRLEDDLARRDFTVNAMAMDARGALTDLFGGRADLDAGVLRCVGDPVRRFDEDALRLLRAVRFSAQLGFSIEEQTRLALARCAHFAAGLSAERVRDEMEKTLCSPRPRALEEMARLGLLAAVGIRALPELGALAALPAERALRWAALGALAPELDATRLRLPRADRRAMEDAAALGVRPRPDAEVKDALASRDETAVRAVCALSGDAARLARVRSSGECIYLRELAVSGRDIPQRGAAAGECLARLLRHVHAHPEDNRREILLNMACSEEAQSRADA